MKILVVSDTHGNQRAMREAISRQGPFDCLIHLGDGVQDGIAVAGELGIPFHGVCGNEDFDVAVPETLRLVLGTWTFYLMHGHQLDINAYQSRQVWEDHLAAMADRARKKEAQVFLFGHTHRPLLTEVNGIVIGNPGDQYIGSALPPSLAVIELTPDTLNIKILRQGREGDWVTLVVHEAHHPGIASAAAKGHGTCQTNSR